MPTMTTTAMSASREFFDLIKNSKLAQVAKPQSKSIRGNSNKPTHQTIFTPSSSAHRSNYGLKTILPSKIGKSYISFNDIDNHKGMPDVEKNSGDHYTRLIFQELGMPLKNHFTSHNPLFPQAHNKSSKKPYDKTLTNCLNLELRANPREVVKILRKNPKLYSNFRSYVIKKYPQVYLSNTPSIELYNLIKEYLGQAEDIEKRKVSLESRAQLKKTEAVQGTGGFSYNQKGRLCNTPNGIRYNTIAPGRIVGTKEAAIGGMVASVIDRSIALQTNYARNSPGKQERQFTLPFKINETELVEEGSVRVFAEGIKTGNWSENDERYLTARNTMNSSSDRSNSDDESLESLLNLILPKRS
ncbi:MRP51 [Candida oxycetoniae]|uniref:MRP51 n=1 Tax=Candida oxycetoniae TaxID=497107 RepID=A0AAI9WYU3_9ASCO|nr:MRP51 [Candida oxycetoniae]KAI3405711.2 MRP51 [Candida oxycetoniae]